MRKSYAFIWVMATAIGTAACGDDGTGAGPTLTLSDGPFGSSVGAVTASSAEDRATGVVEGQVVSSRRRVRRGYDVFEVYVLTPAGTVVSVYVVADTGEILEVEQESEGNVPDLRPRDGFISLAEAIEIAQRTQAGTVIRWELEPDDDSRWQYEVYLRAADGQLYEVEIDARSGAVLEVELESDDDDWEPSPIQNSTTSASRAQIEVAAQALVDGRITKIEIETEDGYRAWKVDVQRASGPTVELRLLDPSLALVRAEGDEGPFDYDLDIGPSYLSLAEARAVADPSGTATLERWKLDRERGRFVWALELTDGEDDDDVEVDAVTGALVD